MVLKLPSDVSLESVSPEEIRRDMLASLLSESTVFTCLPVFKSFVESYQMLRLIQSQSIQRTAHSVTVHHHGTL